VERRQAAGAIFFRREQGVQNKTNNFLVGQDWVCLAPVAFISSDAPMMAVDISRGRAWPKIYQSSADWDQRTSGINNELPVLLAQRPTSTSGRFIEETKWRADGRTGDE